jgi:3-dehydroquinate synthase
MTLPSGERVKSLRVAEQLYAQLLEAGCDRGSLLVIVGGGVLGDLGGFVAATYMRGIPYVQVPTTLLAQVDSSVGGKVAVDLPQGKNLVGAFHQPLMTLIDPDTLGTLPLRHWRNGFAEMLKYGAALHIGLWRRLQIFVEAKVVSARRVHKETALWAIPIARCVSLKAQIVSDDERDLSGRRALLNFGHTVGHAIEAALSYRGWLHGEAIAAGMVAEAEIGRTLGVTPPEIVDELRQTIAQAGLPTQLPAGVDADTLLTLHAPRQKACRRLAQHRAAGGDRERAPCAEYPYGSDTGGSGAMRDFVAAGWLACALLAFYLAYWADTAMANALLRVGMALYALTLTLTLVVAARAWLNRAPQGGKR